MGLLPLGRSGLKRKWAEQNKSFLESPSAWKEWIETSSSWLYVISPNGLLPLGRSGLKRCYAPLGIPALWSPSAWKEWIETLIYAGFSGSTNVSFRLEGVD